MWFYPDNASLYKSFIVYPKTKAHEGVTFSDDKIVIDCSLVIAQSLKSIIKINFEAAIRNKTYTYKTSINAFRPLIAKIEHVAETIYGMIDLKDIRILPIVLSPLMKTEITDSVPV